LREENNREVSSTEAAGIDSRSVEEFFGGGTREIGFGFEFWVVGQFEAQSQAFANTGRLAPANYMIVPRYLPKLLDGGLRPGRGAAS